MFDQRGYSSQNHSECYMCITACTCAMYMEGINLGHLCVLILLGHTNNASGTIKL